MAEEKFLLPPPKFKDEINNGLNSFSRHLNPHFSTPNGMLLPREKQPPPMFGPRGSTVPPQFLSNPRKRPAPSSTNRAPGPGNYRQNHPGGMRNNYQRGRGGQNYRSNSRPPHNNGLDKEVKPELLVLDWKLWCEGCDVNCRSEAEFEQHKANHTPCTVPGCSFVGHPMIMKRHDRQVHRDDGSTKDTVGPSSEEIQQWKEERRKRYPTKQNVILRQQAQEARFNRGERIEEKKDRFPNRPGAMNGDSNGKGQTTSNVRNVNRSQKRKKRSKIPFHVPVVDEKTNRIAFAGTSSLKDYKDPPKNALAMLGEYGSESEYSSDEEDEQAGQTASEEKLSPEKTIADEDKLSEGEIVDEGACDDVSSACLDQTVQPDLASNESQSKDQDEENPSASTHSESVSKDDSIEAGSSSNPVSKNPTQNQTKRQNKAAKQNKPHGHENVRKPNRGLLDYSKLRRANQNTMLEKLLDADIRHERNVLLQCVRHVIVNQFFGIGQQKPTENAPVSNEDSKE